MQIPWGRKSDQARSAEASTERLVNYFLDIRQEDSKSRFVLYGTPGLDLFSAIGSGRIRGTLKMNGNIFVVSGPTLYRVDIDGVATSMGAISGTADVSMARVSDSIAIVSPDTGDGYVATASALAQITDADWVAAIDVTSLDGYAIYTRKDSGQFFISALLDPGNINALDFATAEGAPDDMVAGRVDHRDLLLFGEETTEVWFNSGNADFPFERRPGVVIERGCHHAGSIAKDDNSTFWLGDDLIVYRLTQFTPVRISHEDVETDIAANPGAQFESWTYTYRSHKFYVLSFAGHTWVYDMLNGLWHERQSFGKGRWRTNHGLRAFNKDIVGDFETGNLYSLNMDTYTENGETIQRIVRTPPLSVYPNKLAMSNLIIDFEGGVGLTTGQGNDPQVMLRWSDDAGRTWSNELWRDIGKIGKYNTRAKWSRLGAFEERVFEAVVSDPVKCVILGSSADVESRAA